MVKKLPAVNRQLQSVFLKQEKKEQRSREKAGQSLAGQLPNQGVENLQGANKSRERNRGEENQERSFTNPDDLFLFVLLNQGLQDFHQYFFFAREASMIIRFFNFVQFTQVFI